MADENKSDPVIQDANLYLAFQLMRQEDFESAESHIDKGLEEAEKNKDVTMEGLYLSAKGILYKLKKDYKKSYKYYQKAERLLKDDHSIKIISSVLLIDQFKQYETAVRKLEKTIGESEDPTILHHAKAIQAIGYFQMGKKDKALENLKYILAQDFESLRFAANLDFKLVQLFVEKRFSLDLCQTYLEKSLDLAQRKKEAVFVKVIQKLIEGVKALTT